MAFFNSSLKVHVCVCAEEGQPMQDMISWWVNFESSPGGCPTQITICKALNFRSFFTKGSPSDVDEVMQSNHIKSETVWARCCKITWKALPEERELRQAQSSIEAIPNAPEMQWQVFPFACAIKDLSCSILLLLADWVTLALQEWIRDKQYCSTCQGAFCIRTNHQSALISSWCLNSDWYIKSQYNPQSAVKTLLQWVSPPLLFSLS